MIPVSPGELADKISILQIKADKIGEPAKLANVRRELELLEEIAQDALPGTPEISTLRAKLREVNLDLWAIEDDIRAFERRGDFGPGFIALARSVYVTNDQRADLKKRIDILLGSVLTEEKSYPSAGSTD